MTIRADRIRRDLEAIAACTLTPGAGASRPTFSSAWREARDHVAAEAERAGCAVRVDAAGNVHARPASVRWDEPVWLCGSHVDSVPNGGDYDGVVGVVVPLEILRASHESGRDRLPLELVVFAEEEGTTFGLGMLGSHAWAGSLSADKLGTVRDREGRSYLEAGAGHGVRPADLRTERLDPRAYRGLLEVHVEQGAGLWKRGERLAVVTAIAGRNQYRARIAGRANHAGSTAMDDRQDALAGAAELIVGLERLAGELSPRAVVTVGRIAAHPNAVNVIAGEVELTIDFRDADAAVLHAGDARIRALVDEVAARRGLGATLEATETLPATPLDAGIVAGLQAAAARAGLGALPTATSGALHDAAILAPHLPTAMLFVASRDGISHNPAEHSRLEDIVAAAEVVWEFLNG